ncbi:MAG: dihydrolipoamide acetyltransferase family protein [Prochloraceae cyanobacterium]
MIRDIFMPALSSTMTEGKIVSWTKSPGDKIEKGETVVVVESDKADMDVESFYEGYLATILVEEGLEAPVGAKIALIAETEAEIETAKQQAKTTSTEQKSAEKPAATPAPVAATSTTTASSSSSANGRLVASPRARKLAKANKIDLKTLEGSGPYGRIVADDVLKAAGKTPQPTPSVIKTPQPVAPAPQAAPPAPTPVIPGETVPLNKLQQVVVRNMVASLQVPEFRVSYTITTDPLDRLYKQIKPKGVTMTALLAKAVAMCLVKHPKVNASYTENAIHYNSAINIAVAVAMPDGGLITPVLQNPHEVDIYSLSRTWKDLVNRARNKQLGADEYSSGTFTLSNLGMFGVTSFDAILPYGSGSILAVGASRPQVVVSDDGMFGVKRQMNVNITCDHRIIYGADAAAFLQDLAKLLETETQSLTL